MLTTTAAAAPPTPPGPTANASASALHLEGQAHSMGGRQGHGAETPRNRSRVRRCALCSSFSCSYRASGGWLVYRSRLCRCARGAGDTVDQAALLAAAAASTSTSPESRLRALLHSQAGVVELEADCHLPNHAHDELARRRRELNSPSSEADHEAEVDSRSSPSVGSPVVHSSECEPILVKTRLHAHFTAEQTAKLQYEAVLLEKLHSAETAATAPTSNATPHLRYLPDGRLALVQADYGGVTVRQLIRTRVLALPPSSAHLQSAVFPSLIPSSRATLPPPTLDTTTTALTCALEIARKLSIAHGLSLVVKSLRPNIILIKPETGRVDLLQLKFGSLQTKDRVEANFNPASHSPSAWRYLAPEQSGKANRGIDARTDLYSLGVILYELLTGRPPFQSSDTLELIHQHLARAPPQIVPRGLTAASQPRLFSALTVAAAIASKLLQKQAEDRYQTTAGLIHDLTRVLDILRQESSDSSTASPATPSALSSFQIGQLDLYSTFRISQRLYGREEEVRQLIHAYQRICPDGGVRSPMFVNSIAQVSSSGGGTPSRSNRHSGHGRVSSIFSSGEISTPTAATLEATTWGAAITAPSVSPQLVLISGYSGVGKTSLVDELHKHIVRQRGLFARGKFDLFKRDSSCLLQAFRQLIIQLTVTDSLTWRVRLLRALGSNGQLICEVIPELTRLIGEQPPVGKLGASESAGRFGAVFCQFVLALATAASPLTIFLDDLQWADSGSLALLRLLFQQESAHLLIIGAYRDNEVDASHPLTRLIAEAKESPSPAGTPTERPQSRVTEMSLRPLALTHITQLLCDSFQCSDECALPLAQLLLTKTQGNPFFISTMLRTFYDEGLLTFNFETAKWEPQLELMRLTVVQEDVVEVLCKQMLTLTPESQTLLQCAACSGNTFTLHTLSVVTQLPLHTLVQAVRAIEQAGLIVCTQHARDLVLLAESISGSATISDEFNEGSPSPSSSSRFHSPSPRSATSHLNSSIVLSFLHDHIQLAAYRLIPLWALPAMHRSMARQLLLAYDTLEETQEYARDIMCHINAGYLAEPVVDAGSDAEAFARAAEETAQAWSSLLAEDGLIDRLIELELTAASQAKAACAFDIAKQFLFATIRLLSRKDGPKEVATIASPEPFPHVHEACWNASRASCIHVYHELIPCFLLMAEPPRALQCVEYALSNLDDVHEQSPLVVLHIQTLGHLANLQGCLDVGLSHLASLGTELLPAEMSHELEAWLFDVPDINDETTYRHHPMFRMEEMNETIEVELLGGLLPGLLVMVSPLLINVVLTMLDLTRRRGLTIESARALSVYGVTLWRTGHHDKADALARLSGIALDFLDECSTKDMRGRTVIMNAEFTFPWSRPLRECVALLDAAFDDCLSGGLYDILQNCSMFLAEVVMLAGVRLDELRARAHHLHTRTCNLRGLKTAAICRFWLEFSETMMGLPHPPRAPPPILPTIPMFRATEHATRGLLLFFANRMVDAVDMFRVVNSCVAPAMPLQSNTVFYQCIAVLQSCPKATLDISAHTVATILPANYDPAQVIASLAEADSLIARMSVWADHAPVNYRHKLKLMQAERNRVAMLSHLACNQLMVCTVQLYEEAVEGAGQNEFHLEHALSLELMARFQIDCGRRKTGLSVLKRAYAVYSDTHAVLKTDQLAVEFPDAHLRVSFLTAAAPSAVTASVQSTRSPSSAIISRQASIVAGLATTRGQESSPSYSSSSSGCSSTSAVDATSLPSFLDSASAANRGSLTSAFCPASSSADSSHASLGAASQAPSASIATTCSSSASASLDALSVLKATSTFSTEKDQKKLLKRLMRIVLETAGATRGALVLEDQEHEWAVELSASIDRDDLNGDSAAAAAAAVKKRQTHDTRMNGVDSEEQDDSSQESESTVDHGDTQYSHIHLGSNTRSLAVSSTLPISVLNFVLGSVETVLLSDPHSRSEFSAFASDPYFETHSPRALLCMPLLKGGAVFGVLYLENDFHAEAFTSSHIQLLQLLCGQAALSIDNARLYSELSQHNARLEEVVMERTGELEVRNTQLQAAKEDAERATRIKAEFLSNMSHEIRTPMNAVLGIGRLLSDTALTLEQQQYVSMINNSGNLLLTIINDILDYSKIEAGHLKLSFTTQNVLDVAETAVMLCHDMARTKGLEFSWEVDPKLPANLQLDASRLQQVLLNLLSNAIKFTKKGGRLQLKVTGRRIEPLAVMSVSGDSPSGTPRLVSRSLLAVRSSPSMPRRSILGLKSPFSPAPHDQLHQLPPSPQVQPLQSAIAHYRLDFSVSDTGIGISVPQLAKLFRSFSQVQHVSGEYGGTGLGLVISKRLVEAMGGEMRVESQPGVGSTFSFFIQSAIAAVEPSSASPLSNSPSSRAASPLARNAARTMSDSSSPAMPRRRITSDGRKSPVPLSLASPSSQLHNLNGDDLRLLASANIVYIGERTAATNGYVRLLEHYGGRVHVCAHIADAAEHIQSHWRPSSESAATVATEALIVDLNSPGVSEDAFREQISSLMAVRSLLTYFKKQPTKVLSPTVTPPQHVRSNTDQLPVPPAPFTPVIPLLSTTDGPFSTVSLSSSSSLSSLPRFLQAQSMALLSHSYTAPTSPLSTMRGITDSTLSSLPGSTLFASRTLPASVTRRIRKPTKQRVFLRELIILLSTPFGNSVDSSTHPAPSRSQSQSNSPSLNSTSLVQRATAAASANFSPPPPKSTRILNIAKQHPLRILLAEDNLTNQRMMTMMMKKLGYELIIANNGHEVLAMLEVEAAKGRDSEVECILMDASMDVMDGIECTRVIRAQQQLHRTRPFIIAQTANVTEEYQQLCKLAGMDRFCPKPIRIEELQRCLRAAHQAHQPLRA